MELEVRGVWLAGFLAQSKTNRMRACMHADGGTNLSDFDRWFKARPFLLHVFNHIFAEIFAFFDVVAVTNHINITVRIITVFFDVSK